MANGVWLRHGQVTVTGDAMSTVTANIDDRWARATGDRDDRDRGARSGMMKASGPDRWVTVTGGVVSTVTANIDDRWARATCDRDDRDRGVRSGMMKASGPDRWATVTGGVVSTVHVSKTVIHSVLPLLMCDDDRRPAASGVSWSLD